MTEKDTFRMGLEKIWVTMMNEENLITITIHNEARNQRGSMHIALAPNWKEKDHARKVITIDSEEKFLKFWDALMLLEAEV